MLRLSSVLLMEGFPVSENITACYKPEPGDSFHKRLNKHLIDHTVYSLFIISLRSCGVFVLACKLLL